MITFKRFWEEKTLEEAQLIIREKKMEQLKINISQFKEDTSRDEEYEELNSSTNYYPS